MTTKTQINILNIGVKIGIIALMVLAENDMPYGFYRFLRMFCTISFLIVTGFELNKENYILSFFALIGVILFNPIYPVVTNINRWRDIDGFVAVIVFLWIELDIIRLIRERRRLKIG